MKARITAKTITSWALATLLVLLMIPLPSEAQTIATGTYVYTLGTDGSADVNIIISNVTGQSTVYVKVDPGILPESLIAVDEKGDIIPTNIVSTTLVQAIPANQSTQLFIRYEAIVGEASGGLVKDIISPGGPATVRLPTGAALLYFNGTPSSIKMIGNQIVIEYPSQGTYEIEFTLPPPPTTTSAITTAVTTTTTSTTSTSTTSSTSTTASTSTSSSTTASSSTTTSTSTTSTTHSTATSSTASSTTGSITATTTASSTSTTSSAATPTTSTTSTTTSIQTITQRTTSKASSSTITAKTKTSPNITWVYALVIIAVIAAIVAAAALRSRRKSQGSSSAASMGELIHAEELDERDYEILKALKESTETISSLARRLGLSKSVVWRRVQKLLRLGLISKEDKGGRTYLNITEEGLKKLGGEA